MHPFIFLFASIALNVFGQVLLKAGMQRIGHFEFSLSNIAPVGWQIFTSLPIIGGIVFFISSIMMWLMVLSRLDLSAAYPITSLGYVLVALAAYFWLGEPLSPMRMAGIMVIVLGVWMVSRTA